jgi:hypothetical protein
LDPGFNLKQQAVFVRDDINDKEIKMCMRKKILNVGEKIFNVMVIIAFVAGIASGIFSGIAIGGVAGIAAAALQVLLSWSGTLIIALIVYSLLDIRHSVEK